MPNPTTLLLDVMNTLVYDPIEREIPAFFDLTLDELYTRKHPTAWVEFERGGLSEAAFYETYFPDRPEPIDGEELREVLYDAYRFLDGVEPILKRLRDADIPMYALSNYPVWYEIIEDKLELSRFLSWDFVSCNTGCRKPDEDAYLRATRTLGVAPEDCLFIDDRKINCEAARRVGMDAIVFEDADQLRDQLARRGLPTFNSTS